MATEKVIGVPDAWQEPQCLQYWLSREGVSALNNMDTPKRQIEYKSAGIDWLSYWVYGTFVEPEAMSFLFQTVAEAREKAENPREIFITVARTEWRVLPGVGKGDNTMAFKLSRGPVSVGFRMPQEGGGPCAWIQVTGQGCAGVKPLKLYAYTRQVLEGFGVEIKRCRPMRADIAIDVSGVYVAEFRACLSEGRCVHQGSYEGQHDDKRAGQRVETIRFGSHSSPYECVIYDKSVQLGEPKHAEERAAYLEAWGLADVPRDLVRVEFRVNSQGFEDDDVEAFCRKVDIYASHLMRAWLRFTDKPVDRLNSQRSKGGRFWEGLREFAVEFIGQSEQLQGVTNRRPERVVSPGRTAAQLIGMFALWISKTEYRGRVTLDETLRLFADDVTDEMRGKFDAKLRQLLREMEVGMATPVDCLLDVA